MCSDPKLMKSILSIALAVLLVVPVFGIGTNASEDDSIIKVFEDATILQDCNVYCGVDSDFDAVSSLKSGDKVKILARIQNWYMIYDYSTGCVGAINSNATAPSEPSDPTAPEDPTAPSDPTAPEDAETITPLTDEEKFLNMVNGARSELKLTNLKSSELLNKLAFYKARDIVENNNFSHNSVSYGSPFEMMRAEGVVFTVAGENISGNQTIDGAFYSMMNSETNKGNILSESYTTTGIGIYTSPIYGKVIVQLFTGE